MRDGAKYDVALSFAGDQRSYVEEVAKRLRDAGVNVFYDDYEKADLWGKDLYSHLDFVYRRASRYCVIFISESYAAKVWTNHERRSAQARAFEENYEYLLPARFDETELSGLPPTIGFLDLREMQPEDLVSMIRQKLGPHRLTPGFPQGPDRLYQALHLHGNKAKVAKEEARRVAHSYYEALCRMTPTERRAVVGAYAFGCIGELPAGIHISLDLLSRMTRMPHVELLDALGAVRSLNIKVAVRDFSAVHPLELGEHRRQDKDLLVSFWSGAAPHAKDPNRIVYYAVQEASRHFCADHGLDVVAGLDFHRLSGAVDGPLTIEEEAHEADVERERASGAHG